MRYTPRLDVLPAAALLLATSAPACAPAPLPPAAPLPVLHCEPGDTALVRDVIYFGRNRPDGGVVTDPEWQSFLDSVVTPRFPAGFTVTDAEGHWRGATGVVERERTEVVTLLHSGDERSRDAVAEVAEEYLRRFRQEAVLRERLTVCAHY